MSTPDRKYQYNGLLSSPPSRRNYEESQQQHQRSPFSRARNGNRVSDYIDLPRRPRPSYRIVDSPRGNIGQARSLQGALETVYREDGPAPVSSTSPSPGRRRRRDSLGMSPVSRSPAPPADLLAIYDQIGDEGSLVEDADNEDLGEPLDENVEDGDISSPNYLGSYADKPHRKKIDDLIADEQRLRHVTTKNSPVLNRTKRGIKGALTAESLQRHDRQSRGQMEADHHSDDDLGPSINVPSNWGSRANNHQSWGRRNGIDTARNEDVGRVPAMETDHDIDFNAQQRHISDHLPQQREHLERTHHFENNTTDEPRSNLGWGNASREPLSTRRQEPAAENPVLDTPVLQYKTSTFTKPSPRKRDSQDLLRRLARTETPSQMKTPEPQKPPENRIYDKTPIVSGAYIDTPVTERAPHRSEDPSQIRNTLPTWQDDEPRVLPQPLQSQADAKPNPDASSKKEITKPPLKRPRLPRSGLDAIIEEAKSGNLSDPLGDSTIESLEKFKQSAEEKPGKEEEGDEGSDAYQHAVEEQLAREAKNPARKPDAELEDLKAQRQTLSDKIAQLQKGPDRQRPDRQGSDRHGSDRQGPDRQGPDRQGPDCQEKRRLPECLTDKERETSSRAVLEDKKPPKHLHDGEVCEKCGACNDGRVYAAIPLPRLWKRDPVSRRIRITHLGWCTIISLLWFLSESTMCDYYCHPLIAEVCEGNCLMPDAPRFPFVIPTVLWRWLHLETILAPVVTISVAFFRLTMQLLGFWDGFVDDATFAVNPATETSIHSSSITDVPEISTTQSMTASTQEPWHRFYQAAQQGQGFDQDPIVNLDDDSFKMDDDEYVYI